MTSEAGSRRLALAVLLALAASFVVLHFQLGVKLAAAEAGIFAYDSAMADVKNVAFLREEAETARRLGFLGKSAIHPSQVAVINEVFRPTEAEIAHSLKVVASAKENAAKGVGAWTVDTPEDITRMRQAGVDSITSNRPDLLA